MSTSSFITHAPDDLSALLRERELALRWRRSLRTMQRWRKAGYGPAHLRIGNGVFYRREDVLAFEALVRQGGEAP